MSDRWRSKLSEEDTHILNDIISSTFKYKHVYSKLSKPQSMQLWLALVELHKKQKKFEKLISKLERLLSKMEKEDKDVSIDSILNDLKGF